MNLYKEMEEGGGIGRRDRSLTKFSQGVRVVVNPPVYVFTVPERSE